MKKLVVFLSLVISVLFSISFSTANADTVTYPEKNSDILSKMFDEFYLIQDGIRKLSEEKEKIIKEIKADEENNKNYYSTREVQKKLYIELLKKNSFGAEDFLAVRKCAKIVKNIETLSEEPIIVIIKTFAKLDDRKSLHRAFTKAERTMDQLIQNGLQDSLFEINIFDDFSRNEIVKIQTKIDEEVEKPCDPRLERIKIIDSHLKKLESAAQRKKEAIAFRLENLE